MPGITSSSQAEIPRDQPEAASSPAQQPPQARSDVDPGTTSGIAHDGARTAGDSSASLPPLATGYSPGGPGWSVTITPRTLWLGMGIVLLTIGLIILLVKAIYVWILLFIAIVIAEGLRPLMNWLHRRLRLPQPAAVFLLYLIIVAIIAVLLFFFIQPFITQIAKLTTNFPAFQSRMQDLINRIGSLVGTSPQARAVVSALQSQVGNVVSMVLPLLLAIPLMISQLIFSAIIVAVMTFFWLTGIERLKPFLLDLFPERARPHAETVIATMSVRVGGYLRGVVINMCVIGILSGLGDLILQAPYPLILGVVAGIFELLPYIGPWISGAVAILFCLIFADPIKAVEIIALYIVIQEFEGNTLVPLVMMRTVKLNPLVVLVTVIVGGELLGIVGSVLAVPFSAIIQVLIVEALVPAAHHASAHITETQRERAGLPAQPPAPPPLPT